MDTTVLITGGTGLIGKALTSKLIGKGYKIIILTRKTMSEDKDGISYAQWNIEKNEIDIEALTKADYIIHLAGAGVMDKKWTDEYRNEIVQSRTRSSELLIRSLNETNNKVQAVISSSAIGWYGKDNQPLIRPGGFIESDPPDEGFLGETCRLWEASITPVTKMDKRLVIIRTGIVLSNDGGAYPEFRKSLQFGIASILGSGKQIISWIHIDDLCNMFIYALEKEALQGVYNAVAPTPVNNKKLILKLATRIRKSFFIPIHIPSFMLKTILGERSIEILKSTSVKSIKIQEAGFNFMYPTIDIALDDLCKS